MRPLVPLLVLALAVPILAQDLAPEQRPEVETLVARLSAEDAAARQAAEDALVALGDDVRTVLNATADDDDTDAETRRRIRSILRRLDDAREHASDASLTWAGLRGNPARTGIAGGTIPAAEPVERWAVRVNVGELLQGSVVPDDDRIICLAGDGVVRCYAAKDGARMWLTHLEARISASAVLAAGTSSSRPPAGWSRSTRRPVAASGSSPRRTAATPRRRSTAAACSRPSAISASELSTS